MTEVCFGASIAGALKIIGNRYPEDFGDVAYLFCLYISET